MLKSFGVIAALFILIAAAAAAGYIYFFYVSPIPETIVPDVIGLDEKMAVERIEGMGLVPKIESRNNQSSLVSSQRPEPGKTVKSGRVVFMIIGRPETENPTPSAVVITPNVTPEPVPMPNVQVEIMTSEGEE